MKTINKIFTACGLLSCMSVSLPAVAEAGEGWIGLAGSELKRAVEADCRPTGYVTEALWENGVWEILRRTDSDAGGKGYIDRFSGLPLGFAPSLSEGPPEAVPVNVVDMSWWQPESGVQHGVVHDLYNIFLSQSETKVWKAAYPPGTVAEYQFANGLWSAGYGFIDGQRRMLWNPPAGYEGDVARVMMYMLTVYRDGLITFGGQGGAYASREYYPGISAGALRQLLAWHRADPVDEIEHRRNAEFAKWQGNINPFVEYPALAEFLWGEKCGLPFDGDGHSGSQGGSTSERVPLKPSYNLTDSKIHLYHPAVPDGAVWYVDGRLVSGSYIEPSDAGAGAHELRFEADGVIGKVLIEIRQ
jgi:hypothetical protein